VQVVTDPWLRKFIDLECYALSGMLAKDTICAEMAFMFQERNKPGSTIDYPMGGSAALIDGLVRGITKNGGKVLLRTPVEEVVMENGRAVGVRLSGKGSNGSNGAGQVRCGALRSSHVLKHVCCDCYIFRQPLQRALRFKPVTDLREVWSVQGLTR
jgi:phytoene dehydrogenase-like protein